MKIFILHIFKIYKQMLFWCFRVHIWNPPTECYCNFRVLLYSINTEDYHICLKVTIFPFFVHCIDYAYNVQIDFQLFFYEMKVKIFMKKSWIALLFWSCINIIRLKISFIYVLLQYDTHNVNNDIYSLPYKYKQMSLVLIFSPMEIGEESHKKFTRSIYRHNISLHFYLGWEIM